ncbi:MAG: hypothetical protein C4287_01365, partial [Leptolyngbya sp. ERB_1_2]
MHQIKTPSSLIHLQALLSRYQCDSDLTEDSTFSRLQSAFGELESTITALQQELQQERAARQQAEKAQMLLQMTIEAAADGILAIDLQGKILSINQQFRQQWSIEQAPREDLDLIEITTQRLVDPNQLRQLIRLETEQPTLDGHNLLYFKDGRILERFSKPLRL